MSKESYARGFCKAAAAHGVDAVQLAKYAADSYEDLVRRGELEGYKREQEFKPNLIPYVRDGVGQVGTPESDFSDLPAPNGDLSWLSSTKPEIVPISDGSRVFLPGGAASLTNNPDRVVRIEPGPHCGGTRLKPVWNPGGKNLVRRGDGRAVRYPNGKEIEEVLKWLSGVKK